MSEPTPHNKQKHFWIIALTALVFLVVSLIIMVIPQENWVAWKLQSDECHIRYYSLFFGSDFCGRPVEITCRQEKITNEMLELFPKMSHVYSVDFFDVDFIDLDLKPLTEMPNLKVLTFTGCAHIRQDFQKLGDCSQLNSLYIKETLVLEESIESWEKCPLRHLSLQACNLSDTGLESLSKFSQLENLNLCNNLGITDAGVEHLLKLNQGVRIDLRGTSITKEGMRDLYEKYSSDNNTEAGTKQVIIILTDYGFYNFYDSDTDWEKVNP